MHKDTLWASREYAAHSCVHLHGRESGPLSAWSSSCASRAEVLRFSCRGLALFVRGLLVFRLRPVTLSVAPRVSACSRGGAERCCRVPNVVVAFRQLVSLSEACRCHGKNIPAGTMDRSRNPRVGGGGVCQAWALAATVLRDEATTALADVAASRVVQTKMSFAWLL